MADNGDSVRIGTEAERAQYARLTPLQRAQSGQEMADEVLDHYDHARTLVSSLVSQLRELDPEEANRALHLANVIDAWLNEPAHVAQESRLLACLHESVVAFHRRGMEVSHG
jgi:hypothetical protein